MPGRCDDSAEAMRDERDEARQLACVLLVILRQMPVDLDEIDPRLAELPEWTEDCNEVA